jgi:hypothetical protein
LESANTYVHLKSNTSFGKQNYLHESSKQKKIVLSIDKPTSNQIISSHKNGIANKNAMKI